MIVRRLDPSDVALVASIDRSERVDVQYRVEAGRLVETPVTVVDIPPWDPEGTGDHSVAGHMELCASAIAEGAVLFGATSVYVSATPTGSAVGFYLGRGCTLADPVHPALFADEPDDIHLVFPRPGRRGPTRQL